ncbi:hypothetical protein LXL04_007249 [Taraxacum kok-saghyz]
MRTRKSDNPKSPPAPKRTPPARKSATKTPPTRPLHASQQSPSTVTPKRDSVTRGKTVVTNDTPATTPETPGTTTRTSNFGSCVPCPYFSVFKSQFLSRMKVSLSLMQVLSSCDVMHAVSVIKPQVDTVKATPRAIRTVKRVVKKTVIRKKPKLADSVAVKKEDTELLTEKDSFDEVKDMGLENQQETSPIDAKNSVKEEEEDDDVCMPLKEDEDTMKENKETIDEKSLKIQEPFIEAKIEEEPEEEPEEEQLIDNQEIIMEKEQNIEIEEEPMECFDDEVDMEKNTNEQVQLIENQQIIIEKEKKAEIELEEEPMECYDDEVDMEKNMNNELKIEEKEDPQERVCLSDEEKDNENHIDNDVHEEDDKGIQQEQHGELGLQDQEQEQEHGELGLEEEQEECKVAIEERKRRKEFEIFVGGLDRDTTEEEVKRAFQYVGEVVNIRMHKELPTNKNKGYAFVRFANKDQVARALSEMKNPVIHGKRCGTAPSDDNDTLFLGNICNTWTKEAIQQKLKDYNIQGLENLTLVPNPHHPGTSRGFAFLEFSGHPDAMLAYKRLQKPDAVFGHPDRSVKVPFAEPLRDPDPQVLKEIKVKARLSNPSPKTQAVKGGIAGGFHIRPTFPRAGRGFGRGHRMEFEQRGGRGGYYPHGHGQYGQTSRMGGYVDDYPPPAPHPSFRGRHNFGRGGRWNNFPGPHPHPYPHPHPHPHEQSQGNMAPRYDYDGHRPMHHHHHHHHPMHMPMRGHGPPPPFIHEEEFNRPYAYEHPYMYGDTSRGLKRPFYPEHDPEYMEPSRGRPRLDYPEPTHLAHGSRLRGGGSGMHSRDYYNYDYEGSYSSYYGGDRPYGGGYYY